MQTLHLLKLVLPLNILSHSYNGKDKGMEVRLGLLQIYINTVSVGMKSPVRHRSRQTNQDTTLYLQNEVQRSASRYHCSGHS